MTILDAVLTSIATASANATSTSTQAANSANTAKTTTSTSGGGCLESFTALDQARQSAAQCHEAFGAAQVLNGLLAQLAGGIVVGIVPTPAQLTAAQSQLNTAQTAATTADNAIGTAEPFVRQDWFNCVTGVPAAVVTCITNGITALANAVTSVGDPTHPGVTSPLQNVVANLVASAASAVPSKSMDATTSCNQGVQFLVQAQGLLEAAQGAVSAVEGCLGALGPTPPANPLVAAAQAAITSAQQNEIAQAQSTLDPSNPQVRQAWLNRLACAVTVGTLTIRVTDESNTDFHAGANVELLNHTVVDQLPMPERLAVFGLIDTLSVPTGPDSKAAFTIPFAVPNTSTVPAGAPPVPAGIPSDATSEVASISFFVTHPGKASATGTVQVTSDETANNKTFTIQVNDSSI